MIVIDWLAKSSIFSSLLSFQQRVVGFSVIINIHHSNQSSNKIEKNCFVDLEGNGDSSLIWLQTYVLIRIKLFYLGDKFVQMVVCDSCNSFNNNEVADIAIVLIGQFSISIIVISGDGFSERSSFDLIGPYKNFIQKMHKLHYSV